MTVEVILEQKYNPDFYQFGFSATSNPPQVWQGSNILEIPGNGVYTIYIKNRATKKVYKKVAVINCKDGENVCTITIGGLIKNISCSISVNKIVKLTKPLPVDYFLKIDNIQKVGTLGCRYEIYLIEPPEFKSLKAYNLKIKNSIGQLIKERVVELDTSVYDRIGTTLIDDDVTAAGTYTFEVSTTVEGKDYLAQKSATFLEADLCESIDPCQGKTDPIWTVSSQNYCFDGDLVVDKTQMNDCHTTDPKGTIKRFVVEAGAGQCSEETTVEPPTVPPTPSLNPDVYAAVDHQSVKIRVRNSAASGTYTGKIFSGATEIFSQADLFYNGYCEINSNRFISSFDLCGKTLRFVFSRPGHTFETVFFVPVIVLDSHKIDTSNFFDSLLLIRATKNFDSDKFVLTDIGQNLGMKCFYCLNGSIYHNDSGVANATILSPRPVPPNRLIDVIKYMISNEVQNINDDGWKLFFQNPQANKIGAAVTFKIYSSENQVPQIA